MARTAFEFAPASSGSEFPPWSNTANASGANDSTRSTKVGQTNGNARLNLTGFVNTPGINTKGANITGIEVRVYEFGLTASAGNVGEARVYIMDSANTQLVYKAFVPVLGILGSSYETFGGELDRWGLSDAQLESLVSTGLRVGVRYYPTANSTETIEVDACSVRWHWAMNGASAASGMSAAGLGIGI